MATKSTSSPLAVTTCPASDRLLAAHWMTTIMRRAARLSDRARPQQEAGRTPGGWRRRTVLSRSLCTLVRASTARSAHHHRARPRPHRDDRSAGGYRRRAKIFPAPDGAPDRLNFPPPVNNRFGSIHCRAGHRPSAAARHLLTDTNAGGRRGRDGPGADIEPEVQNAREAAN